MRFAQSICRALSSATTILALAALATSASAQSQSAPPPTGASQSATATQNPGICGSTPFCYEVADFAATVTDFRTSTLGAFKVIDVAVRFQNKTASPLILGYVANSGTAMDDRGNRYIVYGNNAFRGIGQVYGNSFDPKFSIQSGGFGDAQFELMWNPGNAIYGFTFELDLTVDEITTVEGNQHQLGGEFPLIYKGLANGLVSSGVAAAGPNGMTGAAAGGTAYAAAPSGQMTPTSIQAGQPGCQVAGTAASVANAAGSNAGQNASDTANSTVANAASTVSSIKSLFGHKKKPAAAAPAAASASPCPSAAGASSTAPSSVATTSAAIASQTPGAASTPPSTAAPAAAVKSVAATTSTAKTPATSTAPAKKAAATAATPSKKAPAKADTTKKAATPTTPTKPSQQ